jgi:hypothetical protein
MGQFFDVMVWCGFCAGLFAFISVRWEDDIIINLFEKEEIKQ